MIVCHHKGSLSLSFSPAEHNGASHHRAHHDRRHRIECTSLDFAPCVVLDKQVKLFSYAYASGGRHSILIFSNNAYLLLSRHNCNVARTITLYLRGGHASTVRCLRYWWLESRAISHHRASCYYSRRERPSTEADRHIIIAFRMLLAATPFQVTVLPERDFIKRSHPSQGQGQSPSDQMRCLKVNYLLKCSTTAAHGA